MTKNIIFVLSSGMTKTISRFSQDTAWFYNGPPKEEKIYIWDRNQGVFRNQMEEMEGGKTEI